MTSTALVQPGDMVVRMRKTAELKRVLRYLIAGSSRASVLSMLSLGYDQCRIVLNYH